MKKQAVTALILFLAVIIILINSPFHSPIPGCRLKIIDRKSVITLPLADSHNNIEVELIITNQE